MREECLSQRHYRSVRQGVPLDMPGGQQGQETGVAPPRPGAGDREESHRLCPDGFLDSCSPGHAFRMDTGRAGPAQDGIEYGTPGKGLCYDGRYTPFSGDPGAIGPSGQANYPDPVPRPYRPLFDL